MTLATLPEASTPSLAARLAALKTQPAVLAECERLLSESVPRVLGEELGLLVLAAQAASATQAYDAALRYGERARAGVEALGDHPVRTEMLVKLNVLLAGANNVFGRHDQALAACRRNFALRNDPNDHYTEAETHRRRGALGECRAAAYRGFSCPHTHTDHLAGAMMMRIVLGDWSLVAKDAASRLAVDRAAGDPVAVCLGPAWNGTPASDATLFVVRGFGQGFMHGMGDHIMNAQFLPEAARRVGRLIVDVPAALQALYRHSFRGIPNIEWWDTAGCGLPTHDLHTTHGQLFCLCGGPTGPASSTTNRGALLEPPPGPAVARGPGLNVGICWAASDGIHPGEVTRRSVPSLEVFRPLLALPNVTIHSLQAGPPTHALDAWPTIRRHELRTFGDTARVLASLDVCVSVDTSVAHLAGALGVPTLLMLLIASDARWGLDGDTTVWYESVRLFRQQRPGDWNDVATRAAAMLAARDLPPRMGAALARAAVDSHPILTVEP